MMRRAALVHACAIAALASCRPAEPPRRPGAPRTVSAPFDPAAVVRAAQLVHAAALDPVISPEADLDAPVVAGAPEAQIDPAVATDGTVALVAWSDRRARDEGWIVAARVAADGTVLDPAGILVAAGHGERSAPAVAWGAGTFVVAWQQRGASGTQLVARSVGADGSLPDASPSVLDLRHGEPGRTVATFDGAAFRIAWATFDPYYSRCPLGLATLDGSAAPLATAYLGAEGCGGRTRPALACAGEDCLVAAPRFGYLYGGLYDRAGAPRDPAGLRRLGFASAAEPAAVFDGAQYVLVFQRPGAAADATDVVGARVSTGAAVLDATPFPIATGGRRASPAAAFDGTHVIVAWEERRPEGTDVFGVRVATDGTVVDAAALPVSAAAGAQATPALAASPAGAVVAFADARSDAAGDVHAARLLPGGVVADPEGLLVSRGAGRESRPAVAFDGTRWLVAFEDARAAGRSTGIFGLRLAADGTPLDAAPFAIADGITSELRPAAAGCAGAFVVAWEDYRSGSADVYAARVPGVGAVEGLAPVALATGDGVQALPAVACRAAGALVAWQDGGHWPERPRAVVAGRLDPAGAPLDPAGVVVSTATSGAPPAVALAEGGYAVAWAGASASASGLVLAAPVSDAGVAGPVATICTAPTSFGEVAISSDPGGLHVIFTDPRTSPPQLRAARLSPSGAALDPCGVELPGTAGGAAPALAFDGARHLVAFEAPATGALRAARLAPGGGALGAFDLAAGGEPQRTPSLACDGQGTCLVASERRDPIAGNGRVRIRLVASGPPATRCDTPGECPGGFCVDGVCCDSACGGGDPTDCLACSVAAGAAADGTCAPAVAGVLCRAGAGCDAAERCDGADGACPADGLAADGTACDDGDACTRLDACLAGACAGADPVQCPAGDACYAHACDPATGTCHGAAAPLGTPCDDGDPCTTGDACNPAASVRCRGGAKACPASPCKAAFCSPYTGECGEVAVADGVACDDGSACTVGDRCLEGACLAGPPVECLPPGACHEAGLCDRATGACVYAPRPDGTPCVDADLCTRASACAAGACLGSDPLPCPGADACNDAGACDPATGACGPSRPKADGVACDDGNACTRTDACAAGRCAGSDPVVCAAAGACREAGVCNPATGACASAWRPTGTACDDGDPCTSGDACAGGECRPGAATCPAPDDPCRAATCDPATGACGSAPVAEGTPCLGGHCSAGACVASPAEGGCATGGGAQAAALLALALARLRRRAGVARAAPAR